MRHGELVMHATRHFQLAVMKMKSEQWASEERLMELMGCVQYCRYCIEEKGDPAECLLRYGTLLEKTKDLLH